jgi:hypothetical protein
VPCRHTQHQRFIVLNKHVCSDLVISFVDLQPLSGIDALGGRFVDLLTLSGIDALDDRFVNPLMLSGIDATLSCRDDLADHIVYKTLPTISMALVCQSDDDVALILVSW